MKPEIRTVHSEPTEPILRSNERTIGSDQLKVLVSYNPGTDILNDANYKSVFGQNGEGFEPESFDSVEVVWVQVSSTTKRLLIKDGHHRAKGVSEFRNQIEKTHGPFKFRLRHMTNTVFKNQGITPPEVPPYDVPFQEQPLEIEARYDEAPIALTPKEYVVSLIPATKKQAEIAPLRIATNLMQMWGSFVESEVLTQKYSALAALSFLDDPAIYRGTNDKLENVAAYLDEHKDDPFFEGSNEKERMHIRNGLIDMASVLHEVEVSPDLAAKAAFVIISSHPETIGGASQAERQIAGLLYQPGVRRKFLQGHKSDTGIIREVAREIRGALESEAPYDGRIQQERVIVYKALLHPDLTLAEVREVIRGKNYRGTQKSRGKIYEEFVRDHNRRNFTKQYITTHDINSLTATESLLINNIIGAGEMNPAIVSSNIRSIKEASVLITEIDNFLMKVHNMPSADKRKQAVDGLRDTRTSIMSGKNLVNNTIALRRIMKDVSALFEAQVAERTPAMPKLQQPTQSKEIFPGKTDNSRDQVDRQRRNRTEVPNPEERAQKLLKNIMTQIRRAAENDPHLGIQERDRGAVVEIIVVLQNALHSLDSQNLKE